MNQQRLTETTTVNNGSAAAAFLAGGIGAFAMALITILSSGGVISMPDIYRPIGALSGKAAAALAIWLIAWGALHFKWRNQNVDIGKISAATVLLALIGLAGTSLPFLLR